MILARRLSAGMPVESFGMFSGRKSLVSIPE
jgi:hypothetical protein